MISEPEVALQNCFNEIGLLRLEIEKLKGQNLAQRGIILTIYRLLSVEDSVSKNVLDGNLRELLTLTQDIYPSSLFMRIFNDEIQSFFADNNTSLKGKLKIIQGGMEG
jgi:hypothetical protein